MTGHPERDEELASWVGHALRGLPRRPAPATLELRVHEELRRRAAFPWWRRGFAHWPLVVRGVFILACAAVMLLTLWERAWPLERVTMWSDLGDFALAWAHPAVAIVGSAHELAGLLAALVPTAWVYIGLSVGAMSYAVLFGLGAAAYRALYLQPLNDR